MRLLIIILFLCFKVNAEERDFLEKTKEFIASPKIGAFGEKIVSKIGLSDVQAWKHRLILTPLTFSDAIIENAELNETGVNSNYATLQSQLVGSNYKAISKKRHGESSVNYHSIEYRYMENLRFFYINRMGKSRFDAPNIFTTYEYKNQLVGQFKDYTGNENQERLGVSYYYSLFSFFQLGCIASNYKISQKFIGNSYTIVSSSNQVFGNEVSKTSINALVPGIGFELDLPSLFQKIIPFEWSSENNKFRFIKIIYTNEFFHTNKTSDTKELYINGNLNTNIVSPINPISLSPAYAVRNFDLNGSIENFAIIWRIVDLIGIRYGYAIEKYSRDYKYYLRFPFTDGVNNDLGLRPVSLREIGTQSFFYSNSIHTKSYYKENYFRIEFSIGFDSKEEKKP